ncbi:MAG: MG2 domain-containing protein, partial [Myxococcota bacterium]
MRVEDWDAWTAWWMRWRWEDARKGVLPGEKVFGGTVKVAGDADRQAETRIDLAPYLKGGAGHFVVSVEPTNQPKNRWERAEWMGWVQVTKLGLTAIREPAAVTAWVTDLADGTPRADARIALLGQDGAATTGADGLARLRLTESSGLVARAGDDVAFLPSSPWGNEARWVAHEELDQLRWYTFDDKHLYKPKETVHVRGWLRTAAAAPSTDLRLPEAGTVRWTARSSLGNPLGEGVAKISGLGGFSFDVKLPDTPDLGTARIELATDRGEY